MGQYIIKRLLSIIPLLLVVSIIVFLMVQLVPGDPVLMMLGENASRFTPEEINNLRDQLGFNDPLHIQYLNSIKGFLKGDWGTSIRSKRAVNEEIMTRLPSTLELAFAGLGLAIILGITMGIVSALNHNNIIDNICSFFTMLGVGIPNYWFSLILIYFLGIQLKWLPVISRPGGGIKALIMPALTLGIYAQASIARLVRSGMLETLSNDYIRTARAKGAKERIVIFKHALRNVLIPVVTIVGVQFGSIIAGTTIIETVFSRMGLGLLLVNSIMAKDFPMIQGIMLLVSGSYIIINIIVDIVYAYLDPRIRIVDSKE